MDADPIEVIFSDIFGLLRLGPAEIGRIRCTCRRAAAVPVAQNRGLVVAGRHVVLEVVTREGISVSVKQYGQLIISLYTYFDILKISGNYCLVDGEIITTELAIKQHRHWFRACGVTMDYFTLKSCPRYGQRRHIDAKFVTDMLDDLYVNGQTAELFGCVITDSILTMPGAIYERRRRVTKSGGPFVLLGDMVFELITGAGAGNNELGHYMAKITPAEIPF